MKKLFILTLLLRESRLFSAKDIYKHIALKLDLDNISLFNAEEELMSLAREDFVEIHSGCRGMPLYQLSPKGVYKMKKLAEYLNFLMGPADQFV